MIATGIRQLRMALSIILGKSLDPANAQRLVGDALRTLNEFGSPGQDHQQVLLGPLADPASRRDMQNLTLQRTMRHLAQTSPYYKKLFASLPFDATSMTQERMPQVPVTSKSAFMAHRRDFMASDTLPYMSTRTTGTTGQPVQVYFSRNELELWSALAILGMLLHQEFDPRGCLQVNISLRATTAVYMHSAICRLAGARIHILGLVPVNLSLDMLVDEGEMSPTMLATYPSYLAELLVAARRRGLGPRDFRLRHIYIGSEILSSALVQATRETFGVHIQESYGATEITPVGARVCRQGHLHPDFSSAFFEVIDLNNGLPAAPGEPGTLVITPYFPYRQCMPLFRYDTRDVVRCLPTGPLTCELAGVPATSHLEGKADHLLWFDGQMVTPRALVEAIESLPSQPWPARFRAQVTPQGVALRLPRRAFQGLTEADVLGHLQNAGLPVCTVHCVADQEERELRPLRADMKEAIFQRGAAGL